MHAAITNNLHNFNNPAQGFFFSSCKYQVPPSLWLYDFFLIYMQVEEGERGESTLLLRGLEQVRYL